MSGPGKTGGKKISTPEPPRGAVLENPLKLQGALNLTRKQHFFFFLSTTIVLGGAAFFTLPNLQNTDGCACISTAAALEAGDDAGKKAAT